MVYINAVEIIAVYKKLGYDEHTMLVNLDDIISDVTNGKMHLED